MTRKRTRRKVWPLMDTIRHVTEGIAPTPEPTLDSLRMRELSALEAFRTGRATPDDWRALADMCNLAETLARAGAGPEALEPCLQAQAALGAAHARYRKVGRLGLAGPELEALRELHQWHDAQRTAITRGEYERAIKKAADRIRSGSPDIKVYV